MGRPLKIKNTLTTDIGFNAFDQLTDPVIPGGMTTTEFLGVVGGGFPGGVATATYPTVAATAFVPSHGSEDNVYIITQKGQTKYLVACQSTVAASSLTVGFTYIINTVGDTNWAAVGAGVNAQVGDIFTATANGSGTGLVSDVGICALANAAPGTLTSGQMQITISTGGSVVQVSKLTNKFVWDYETPPVRFAANFFVAGGSGAVLIGGAAVTGTAGQFSFSSISGAGALVVGDVMTVTGTLTGTATGISAGTYYVVATNGTSTFTLSATIGGAGITTTAGTTTGLNFAVPAGVTAKSGAEIDTWTNGTGNLDLADVTDYTS